MPDETRKSRFTRRQTFGIVGTAGAGLLIASGVRGLQSLDGADGAAARSSNATYRPACTLTPEQTEGPYYVDLGKIRRNIVAGRPGVPLTMRVRVVNSNTCKPIEGAAVDIWHCDAVGVYSSEASEGTAGQTFLRGIQLTDEEGVAEFQTIFPGHYQGRTTHIHLKVHIGGQRNGKHYDGGHVSHTGQLFFSEAVSAQVFALAPYNQSTSPVTTHAEDSIYIDQHGASSVLKLKRAGSSLQRDGLRGRIVLGVNPKSTPDPVGVQGPGGGPPLIP